MRRILSEDQYFTTEVVYKPGGKVVEIRCYGEVEENSIFLDESDFAKLAEIATFLDWKFLGND